MTIPTILALIAAARRLPWLVAVDVFDVTTLAGKIGLFVTALLVPSSKIIYDFMKERREGKRSEVSSRVEEGKLDIEKANSESARTTKDFESSLEGFRTVIKNFSDEREAMRLERIEIARERSEFVRDRQAVQEEIRVLRASNRKLYDDNVRVVEQNDALKRIVEEAHYRLIESGQPGLHLENGGNPVHRLPDTPPAPVTDL